MPNSEAVRQCYHSASTNLRIISEFAKLHVLVSESRFTDRWSLIFCQQYCQESVTVMTAYAALVLLRVSLSALLTVVRALTALAAPSRS